MGLARDWVSGLIKFGYSYLVFPFTKNLKIKAPYVLVSVARTGITALMLYLVGWAKSISPYIL